jgi:hypothetical protein
VRLQLFTLMLVGVVRKISFHWKQAFFYTYTIRGVVPLLACHKTETEYPRVRSASPETPVRGNVRRARGPEEFLGGAEQRETRVEYPFPAGLGERRMWRHSGVGYRVEEQPVRTYLSLGRIHPIYLLRGDSRGSLCP